MILDCEQCGHRGLVVDKACGTCGEKFGFLVRTPAKMKPWDYSAWFFSMHNQLIEKGKKLKGKDRVRYVVGELLNQVRNGGTYQYYANPTGTQAAELAEALALIGATKLAKVIGEINALFGKKGVPARMSARVAAIDALPEKKRDALFEQAADLAESTRPADDLLKRLFWYCAAA